MPEGHFAMPWLITIPGILGMLIRSGQWAALPPQLLTLSTFPGKLEAFNTNWWEISSAMTFTNAFTADNFLRCMAPIWRISLCRFQNWSSIWTALMYGDYKGMSSRTSIISAVSTQSQPWGAMFFVRPLSYLPANRSTDFQIRVMHHWRLVLIITSWIWVETLAYIDPMSPWPAILAIQVHCFPTPCKYVPYI